MVKMYANLHLHSTFSDAGFTPEQLVLIGKALGYQALALTDHETDGGCTEFQAAAQREGIETVSGAEFYARFGERRMHLTALDFDRTAPSVRNLIDERCRLQAIYAKAAFDKLDLPDVTWEQVTEFAGAGAWLCYDSLLNLLNACHRLTPELTERIKAVYKQDEAIKALKPAYPEAEAVIRAVRDAGGVIGLAHSVKTQYDYAEKLVDLGMNGIEVSHPNMPPEAIELAEELAQRRGLYRLGGTDHSGPMSCVGGSYAIPAGNGISREDFEKLINR